MIKFPGTEFFHTEETGISLITFYKTALKRKLLPVVEEV